MGYKKGLENVSWGSWKVLDNSRIFVAKRVGTLVLAVFAQSWSKRWWRKNPNVNSWNSQPRMSKFRTFSWR